MSPVEIVEGVRGDDPEACHALVSLIRAIFNRRANRQAGIWAEDCIQEITLAALVAIRSGVEPRNLFAWLLVIGNRKIISNWRREQHQPQRLAFHEEMYQRDGYKETNIRDAGLIEAVPDPHPDPEARAINAETFDRACRFLQLIPSRNREAFLRFHLDERSVLEIAADLHLPENTVKTILRRTRQNLKQAA